MSHIRVHNNIPIDSDNDTVAAIAAVISLSANTGSCFGLPAEIAAAIAAALNLSGKAQDGLSQDSYVAAAIGASLFLHLFVNTTRVHENNHKDQTPSFWSQYGRASAQNARLQVFNRSRL